MEQHRPLFGYAVVTLAYWFFMLTDGALRMLVLLHFHQQGYTPVQLAYLFILYELAGMVTNLAAGWLAARFGLTKTLYAGLLLQVMALLALSTFEGEGRALLVRGSVLFVMLVQGVSGVAKDLTKMSSKAAVKLLAPQKEGGLLRWVALLTGSKNAIKGMGFFAGAVMLGQLGFAPTLWVMAGCLSLVFVLSAMVMPAGLPSGRRGVRVSSVISTNPKVNWLSLARFFLFGARDVLFVVAVPLYFYGVLSDGTPEGQKEAFSQIGVFMAGWVIFYGLIQALTPTILGAKLKKGTNAVTTVLLRVGLGAAFVPFLLWVLVVQTSQNEMSVIVFGVLLWVFAGFFAINSALHSYLILAYTNASRVTLDVGFYYMSNAAGRLFGTLGSGLCYQLFGVSGCFLLSSIVVVCASAVAWKLKSAF